MREKTVRSSQPGPEPGFRAPTITAIILAVLGTALPTLAGSAGEEAILPPELPWSGKSRSLMVPADHPWVTPAEKTRLARTPRYEQTVSWLRKLVDAAPELAMVSLGTSPEGRDIWMVIASPQGASTPEALRANGKPTLLAQAGIHAGEIDGKDAGMMLLRDLTVRGNLSDLLREANFLFVPIFNVDGHERFSRFSRMNQRGPEETGWRVNARRLNLNRDYSKLDTPEMRALVTALNRWEPDLYLDLHVTDGLDYQYDITYGYNGPHAFSPKIAGWLDRYLTPAVNRDLREWGHTPGPLIFPADFKDPENGLVLWTGDIRFSNGYGDARHLPTVLVENHSLKPYDQRVLGTYLFLESALRTLGLQGDRLLKAIASDRSRKTARVPLDWQIPADLDEWLEILGVESRRLPSPISGRERVEWTGIPAVLGYPYRKQTEPSITVDRPIAYWIPPAWSDVIERLAIHGVRFERITEPREIAVEMYRIGDPVLETAPFEGHVRVTGTPQLEKIRRVFPPGSIRVPTSQPLGILAMLLLEPAAPDSFFQWGFFHQILQRTEYAEAYVLEPMAERMLAGDEALRVEFEEKLREDAEFAADPDARLLWFYERTPYFDPEWLLYPVARE